jgi:SAM-dependent methyltransferase
MFFWNKKKVENRKDLQNIAKTDKEYLDMLIQSVRKPVIRDVKFPGFPPTDKQATKVGSTNEMALKAVFRFYKAMKEYSRLHHPLRSDSMILDFGCGWGRIARFFFNDVNNDNVVGVDVDPEIIEFCKANMHYGKWSVIDPLPPSRLQKDSFDLIFAHSVFSHLEEGTAREWIKEFSNILKPGGLLVVTTWGKTFLDLCESLRGKDNKSAAHINWAQAFIPTEQAKADYDQGKFLFEPGPRKDGPMSKSHFGLALIPKKYVEREYTPYLNLIDFVDEKVKDPQAVFVMQKPLADNQGTGHA